MSHAQYTYNTYSYDGPHVGPFAMLLIVIVIIWLILMLATAAQHRKHSAGTDVKVCPGCATPNAPHAKFCRNCGRALG